MTDHFDSAIFYYLCIFKVPDAYYTDIFTITYPWQQFPTHKTVLESVSRVLNEFTNCGCLQIIVLNAMMT